MTPRALPPPTGQDDAKRWETECLRALQERVSAYGTEFPQPNIVGASLEGVYPETELQVRYIKHPSGERQEYRRQLWARPLADEEGREAPAEVAILVHTWVMEKA